MNIRLGIDVNKTLLNQLLTQYNFTAYKTLLNQLLTQYNFTAYQKLISFCLSKRHEKKTTLDRNL